MADSPLAHAQFAANLATESLSSGLQPDPAELSRARLGLQSALADAPADLDVLFLGFQFHFRLAEYDAAERLAARRLELVPADSADAARALTNLGMISQMRGELDAAEDRMTRAIEIDRRLGNLEGLARDLGNLALVPEARGDLNRAEALCKEAIAVAQRLGGSRGEELIAGNIANLGDFALARGQNDVACELWTESLAAFGRLGITKWKASFEKRFADLERVRATEPGSKSGAQTRPETRR